MFDAFGVSGRRGGIDLDVTPDIIGDGASMAGAWPAYLFVKKPGINDKIDLPIGGGRVGMGGNAHAANEFFVIEGAGKTYGMAGAEKSIATVLYNYAGKN